MQQGPRVAGEEERKDWNAAAPVGRVPSNQTKNLDLPTAEPTVNRGLIGEPFPFRQQKPRIEPTPFQKRPQGRINKISFKKNSVIFTA